MDPAAAPPAAPITVFGPNAGQVWLCAIDDSELVAIIVKQTKTKGALIFVFPIGLVWQNGVEYKQFCVLTLDTKVTLKFAGFP
jgi:hypothetical protein